MDELSDCHSDVDGQHGSDGRQRHLEVCDGTAPPPARRKKSGAWYLILVGSGDEDQK